MKKLSAFILSVVALCVTALFFTSCTESSTQEKKYSGTEMYLNAPDKILYEKDWEYVSREAHTVVVTKGDNLWDIAQECSNNPWAWEEIYYMNLPKLSGRLEYRNFPSGEQRVWVWIYPGEILNVPTYFSCPRLEIQGTQMVEYYHPTTLDVKVVESNPGLHSQKILVLDEGQNINPVVYPVRPEKPIFSNPTQNGLSDWWRELLQIIWVILCLVLVTYLLFLLFNSLKRNTDGERDPSNPAGTGGAGTMSETTSTDNVAVLGALTKHLEQLQKTGGKSLITVGNDIQANFDIPNQIDEKKSPVVKKQQIDLRKGEDKK